MFLHFNDTQMPMSVWEEIENKSQVPTHQDIQTEVEKLLEDVISDVLIAIEEH